MKHVSCHVQVGSSPVLHRPQITDKLAYPSSFYYTMLSQNRTTTENTPLLRASRPAGRSGRGPWSPETLLIPVVFASRLGNAMPSTTLAELLRQTVCRLSHRLHGYPSSFVSSHRGPHQLCDAPQVMRDFATVSAIIGVIGGITCVFASISASIAVTHSRLALVGCGILSRILPYHGRKPIFLFILSMQVMWSSLVLGSQFVPAGPADWVFFVGMLFHTFSDHLAVGYLVNMYIVDICLPEHRWVSNWWRVRVLTLIARTAMMSKLGGWGVLGPNLPCGFCVFP